MVLAGFEEDAVAGPDDLNGSVLALAETDAFSDEDGLAVRVRVPGGAGARGELSQAAVAPCAARPSASARPTGGTASTDHAPAYHPASGSTEEQSAGCCESVHGCRGDLRRTSSHTGCPKGTLTLHADDTRTVHADYRPQRR